MLEYPYEVWPHILVTIIFIIIFTVTISRNDYIHYNLYGCDIRNDYIIYNLFGYNIKKFILAKEVMKFEKDVIKFISLSDFASKWEEQNQ